MEPLEDRMLYQFVKTTLGPSLIVKVDREDNSTTFLCSDGIKCNTFEYMKARFHSDRIEVDSDIASAAIIHLFVRKYPW